MASLEVVLHRFERRWCTFEGQVQQQEEQPAFLSWKSLKHLDFDVQ